jgi:hypothetical protein
LTRRGKRTVERENPELLDLATEGINRLGVRVDKKTVGLVAGVLGALFEDEAPRGRRKKASIEAMPEEFFLEVPVLIPAGVDRRGRIELYISEMYEEEHLFNEVQESLSQWEEGNVDIYLYEDEEGEGKLVESNGQTGGIKIVEEE